VLQKHNYRLFISIFYLLPSATAHLADDIAPLGLFCKNITIASSFLYSAYYLLQPSAAHLADDIAPLGLCCKKITIACSFLYSAYYLLQLRTWLMISPRWGYAAKT
jgi:hypothetical protein